MPNCHYCDGKGLFAIETDTWDNMHGVRAITVCDNCNAGIRVLTFLQAIAQGTPVHVRDTAEAGFKPTGVTYPSAVLEPATAGDFVHYPTEG